MKHMSSHHSSIVAGTGVVVPGSDAESGKHQPESRSRQSADILPFSPHGSREAHEDLPRQWQGGGNRAEGARILAVDDSAAVLEVLRRVLEGDSDMPVDRLDALEGSLFETQPAAPVKRPRFQVDLVQDGRVACERAREAVSDGVPYAVAFVDMRMPGGWDGLRTIEELWRADPDIQVVICTAYSDYSWDDIGSRLDCSDRLLILRKPFEQIEVLQLACTLSHKWRLHRERQARLEELELRVSERTQHLQLALSEREAYETQLHFQASHDALTGLPNRALLDDRIARALAEAHRTGQHVAVLFLDLDRFKFINDSFGHTTGDALLKVVAARLTAAVRETDTVARLGGDEFVIVLTGLAHDNLAVKIAGQVLATFAHPFTVQGQELCVTTSIGISVHPHDGETGEMLLKNADEAMYRAKDKGRNSFELYTREMGVQVHERVELERALRRALEQREFELHYQPKVDLASGRVTGVEALIRWRRPEVGMVAPDRFIPLAEETGLIVPIGAWVLETACLQAKAWHAAGHSDLTMAVNVSARQFRQENLARTIQGILAATDLAAEHLTLELTESVLMNDSESAELALRQLKEMGLALALDDFGTGYSSLSYLKRFPIDVVKIDRSFIRDVTTSANDASLTRAIIAMAQSLNMKTVAEGVETAEQAAFVRANRCDAMQGYYFSRPLPADEMTALLRKGKRLPRDA